MCGKPESMETAPRDGTYIIVWASNSSNPAVGSWFIASWADDWVNYPNSKKVKRWCVYGTWQDEQGGFDTLDNPVCWMPLPDNPIDK